MLVVVFVKSQSLLKRLPAILADIIVYGHGAPPVGFAAILTPSATGQSCDYFFSETFTDASVFSQLMLSLHVSPL